MSFASEFKVYVGRTSEFDRVDWMVYVAWVGLMLGLVLSTGVFVAVGYSHNAPLPEIALWVPVGAAIFALSIAIDSIGHRTIYKQEIREGEGLVHGITIFCGITSCILLTLAYSRPAFWVPAMVLTVLSFMYSVVDEAFHWRRYVQKYSDRVEMWSHVGIFLGHGIMMLAWWVWYFQGYLGVRETLEQLG